MELILIVDNGSPHAQLVARRVRQAGAYSEIVPGKNAGVGLFKRKAKGIIILGESSQKLESEAPILAAGDKLPSEAELNLFLEKCRSSRDWDLDNFISRAIAEIKAQVGAKKVICGLSGGVDSAVAAVLVHRAVGNQLTCIYVDNGLMREGETEQILHTFRDQFQIPLIHKEAGARFLANLAEVADPEEKRKIIGREFIQIFVEEARKIGEVPFLVQGTLYSDLVESGAEKGDFVKSHHNVGGLPRDLSFELVEPLKRLFKDEVRAVAEKLALPEEIVWRHPFPGPGLAIRIMGAVTANKLAILRRADTIARQEIEKAGLYREIWQALVVLTEMRTVGVFQGKRTYNYVVALRFVNSEDGMHAHWSRIPHEVLAGISHRLLHEVQGIGRVVYDISPKPPATIEWE